MVLFTTHPLHVCIDGSRAVPVSTESKFLHYFWYSFYFNKLPKITHCYYSMKYWRNWWHMWCWSILKMCKIQKRPLKDATQKKKNIKKRFSGNDQSWGHVVSDVHLNIKFGLVTAWAIHWQIFSLMTIWLTNSNDKGHQQWVPANFFFEFQILSIILLLD